MLITNKHYRQNLKNKKRIVIKVGSSSLVHPETGETDLLKLEQLVRVLFLVLTHYQSWPFKQQWYYLWQMFSE